MSRKTTKWAVAASGPASGSLVDPPATPEEHQLELVLCAVLQGWTVTASTGSPGTWLWSRSYASWWTTVRKEGRRASPNCQNQIVLIALFFSVKTNVIWCLFLSYMTDSYINNWVSTKAPKPLNVPPNVCFCRAGGDHWRPIHVPSRVGAR